MDDDFLNEPEVASVKQGFWGHLRGYFFAGILITAPLGITIYLAYWLVHGVDTFFNQVVPEQYNPDTYLPYDIPGLGLIVLIVSVTLVGWLTAGFLGRLWLRISEGVLGRMPVLRSFYSVLKQIMEAVFSQKSQAFRKVVLVEYPRRGMWSLGFLTGRTEGEAQNVLESNVLNVFIPTTPNPTSGFLIFVPRRDTYIMNMTVEEGFKMIMSAGIITPPDPRADDKKDSPFLISGSEVPQEERFNQSEDS